MDRHPFTDATTGADRLLASTLYLISRYAVSPCPRLASLVDRHLSALASNPEVSTLVREMSRPAAHEWKGHAEGCLLGCAIPPCGE
jgi:hypothetical protein